MKKQLLLISCLSLPCYATEPISEEQKTYETKLASQIEESLIYDSISTTDNIQCEIYSEDDALCDVAASRGLRNALSNIYGDMSKQEQEINKRKSDTFHIHEKKREKEILHTLSKESRAKAISEDFHTNKKAFLDNNTSTPNCDHLKQFFSELMAFRMVYEEVLKSSHDGIFENQDAKNRVKSQLDKATSDSAKTFKLIKEYCPHFIKNN